MSKTVKQGSGDVAKKQRLELKTKQDAVGPRTKQIDSVDQNEHNKQRTRTKGEKN